MIKLRAWDHFSDEMIYSDKYDNLYDFFYDVKRRENGGNKVSLMLASNQWVHADDPIYEGDIIRFHHGAGDEIKTGIVECRPEHFCYWQVKVPGDHFGLGWVVNCCTGIVVTGNRYADREWLEDEGLVGLLDEASREMNRIDREFGADMAADVEPISFASPKLATPPIDDGLLNAVIEAMRPIIREKLEKDVATDPFFIQPGELPEIDPEKEKQADEAMAKLGVGQLKPQKEEIFADEPGVPIPTPKPARLSTYYQDDFNHTIKEGDILSFKLRDGYRRNFYSERPRNIVIKLGLCGRRFTGEVKRIWSNDRYCWQVWTYESPEMKLSLRHMCEDVACTEVRVIGHISTVRRGGVTVQDIGIQL